MPNLTPPVITAAGASAYRDRILSSLVDGEDFEPLMTAYLTDVTDPARSRGATKILSLLRLNSTRRAQPPILIMA